MSDKKNIDRLFQEKFKDFEVKPNDSVWDKIQSKMDISLNNKTRTAIPLWVKIAGIAAILLLMFTVGNSLFNSEDSTTSPNKVVETEKEKINTSSPSVVEENNASSKGQNNKDTEVLNNTESKKLNGNNNNLPLANTSNEIQQNSNKNHISTEVDNTKSDYKSNKKYNSAIANKANPKNKTEPSNRGYSKNDNSYNSSITSNQQNPNNKVEATINIAPNKFTSKDNLSNKKQNNSVIVSNDLNKDNKVGKNDSNSPIKAQNNNITIDNTENTVIITDNDKIDSKKEKESVEVTNTESIEEAIAENENINEEEKEEVTNRWNVYANIAPVYYNSLGKGSHIHDQFVNNPKNGEVNTSYGVMVGYALNNKFKIRSGINKLNLSYDTANVIVYENVSNTPSDFALRNIDFSSGSQGQSISVLSNDNLAVQQISSVVNDELNAALSQRISYIEVPLEIEYKLVDKNKFGLNIIGGASTFILEDNEVVTEVENRKTSIGKANNINGISFSTNLGIGIDYKFSESFKFNLEPTFKYQLNAFENISGDFRPYIVGLYTGFSYKF